MSGGGEHFQPPPPKLPTAAEGDMLLRGNRLASTAKQDSLSPATTKFISRKSKHLREIIVRAGQKYFYVASMFACRLANVLHNVTFVLFAQID